MNICLLTHTFPRNKTDITAAFMKALADGLVEAGNKVVVLTPFDEQFSRKGDKFEVVQYKYFWPKSMHKMGYSRAMEGDLSLRWYNYLLIPFMIIFGTVALIKLIKQKEIDVISVHWVLPNGLIALLAHTVTGVPYFVTLPGTDVYIAGKNIIFKHLAKAITLKSCGVYSNSEWLLKKFFKLGIKHPRHGVVKYPIDVSDYKPLKYGIKKYKKRHGINDRDLVILAVGRLVYKKGFNYLIRAMPEIIKKFPNTKLVIGGEGDQKDEWVALTQKIGVEKNVLFIGNIKRNEIIYYYNMADVNVAPSIVDKHGNVDGGPVVVFESMACGKPQVVTNILGSADNIINGENGFVVPQKNPKGLSRAIIKLLESKKLRVKMGKKNIKIVNKEFTTKKIGEKYTNIFLKSLQ